MMAPSISCPGDQTAYVDGACNAILGDYTSLAVVNDDQDPSPVVSQKPMAGSTIISDTAVTLYATDASGNVDSCSFMVILQDTTSPTAVCQNITVYLNGSGNASITAADVDGGSVDNCAVSNLSASSTSFNCADLGGNSVTLTVSDASGNMKSCIATVTVQDTTAPTAVCQNITVYLDGSGNASITASDVDGGSSDICSVSNLSASPTSFTCADLGGNSVTLTVSDASGNMKIGRASWRERV